MNDRRLTAGALLASFLGVAALAASPAADPQPAGGEAAARPRVPVPTYRGVTTTAEPATPAPAFTVASIDVHSVGAEAELPAATVAGVQTLLDRYLDTAVVRPLATGQNAGDLSPVFSGSALERMNGPDRAALVDEDLPGVGNVRVSEATADLTALAGPDGVSVMAAGIRLLVTATLGGAPLTVERTGELLLDDDGGGWRVTGYSVTVTRESAGSATTTTVRP